jgi:hypothetical protein
MNTIHKNHSYIWQVDFWAKPVEKPTRGKPTNEKFYYELIKNNSRNYNSTFHPIKCTIVISNIVSVT